MNASKAHNINIRIVDLKVRDPSFVPLSVWFKGRSVVVISHLSYGLDAFTLYISSKQTGLNAVSSVAEAVKRIYDTIQAFSGRESNAPGLLGTLTELVDSLSVIIDLLDLFELQVDEQGNVTGIKIHRDVVEMWDKRDWVAVSKRIQLFAMHALTIPVFLSTRLQAFELNATTLKALSNSISVIYIAYQVMGAIEAINQIIENQNRDLACAKLVRHMLEISFQIAMLSTGGSLGIILTGAISQTLDVVCDIAEQQLAKRAVEQLNMPEIQPHLKYNPVENYEGLAALNI